MTKSTSQLDKIYTTNKNNRHNGKPQTQIDQYYKGRPSYQTTACTRIHQEAFQLITIINQEKQNIRKIHKKTNCKNKTIQISKPRIHLKNNL